MKQETNEELSYEQIEERRRLRRQQRKRQVARQRMIFIIAVIAVIAIAAALIIKFTGAGNLFNRSGSPAGSGTGTTVSQGNVPSGPQTEPAQTEAPADDKDENENQSEAAPAAADETIMEQAELMAMGYDYDGAIDLLKTVPSYDSNSEITSAISKYEEQKAACVAVDVNTVPHIFYHSLVNDPSRAFNVSVLGQGAVDGMNAWMTTVEEFDKITQQMYDRGYVFVRLRDLVTESRDANGNVTFTPNTSLMLPPDKKAVVLSVDDLSYYHSYEAAGYPDKLVLDENGKVKCHYVTADGTEQIGDFDVVPRLNTFLEAHPDGAYKGARGLIALTGYNGVLGYRTDIDYEVKANLMADQSKWLDEHPDFNRQKEIEEATVIADAIKESGWEFASHTWGHLSVTNKTAEQLQVDNEKWVNTVQNVVGPVDTIIFAHGNDIGDWQDYSSDNAKYNYFKNAGYNFFCNVDSSVPYWVQIRPNYVRQGRIDMDGYQLYQSSIGATTVLDNMIKASEVFDSRRPTPVVANGES